jgi:hypothetical protein
MHDCLLEGTCLNYFEKSNNLYFYSDNYETYKVLS